jgi:hypothetical protein
LDNGRQDRALARTIDLLTVSARMAAYLGNALDLIASSKASAFFLSGRSVTSGNLNILFNHWMERLLKADKML